MTETEHVFDPEMKAHIQGHKDTQERLSETTQKLREARESLTRTFIEHSPDKQAAIREAMDISGRVPIPENPHQELTDNIAETRRIAAETKAAIEARRKEQKAS